MIQAWGSWSEFQTLLAVLSSIAGKLGVSLTNVATRWVLQQPGVGAVIVGTRLGVSSHIEDNLGVFRAALGSRRHRIHQRSRAGAERREGKSLVQ